MTFQMSHILDMPYMQVMTNKSTHVYVLFSLLNFMVDGSHTIKHIAVG